MTFCVECGSELAEGERFCTSCGTSVATVATEQTVVVSQKKSMNKLTKILIGVVIAIIILLFGTHNFLTSYFDPMKDLLAMSDAISDNDATSFNESIDFEKNVLFDGKSYFAYIKESEWNQGAADQYAALIEREKQGEFVSDRKIYSVSGEPLYELRPKSILFGLYKGYTVKAIPQELEISSEMEGLELEVGSVKETLKDAEEILSMRVFPGEFEISAKSENEYGEFEYNDILSVVADGYQHLEVEFEQRLLYVSANYGYTDAIVFVNDKSTESSLDDISSIGPVPMDADLLLYAEWENEKGDKLKSNVIKLKDYKHNDVYFEFDESRIISSDVSDLIEMEAGEFVLAFRDAYEDAVNNADFNAVSDFLKPGAHAAEDLKPFIKEMGGSHYYDFVSNEVLKVKKAAGNKYEVDTNEVFNYYDEKNKRFDYDREKRYFLELDKDKFQVVKIDYIDTKKKANN